jgi:hypothetical protein
MHSAHPLLNGSPTKEERYALSLLIRRMKYRAYYIFIIEKQTSQQVGSEREFKVYNIVKTNNVCNMN